MGFENDWKPSHVQQIRLSHFCNSSMKNIYDHRILGKDVFPAFFLPRNHFFQVGTTLSGWKLHPPLRPRRWSTAAGCVDGRIPLSTIGRAECPEKRSEVV